MPRCRLFLSLLVLFVVCVAARAQQLTPVPPGSVPTLAQQPQVPANSIVAATVNGQSIPELAVYRALKNVPPAKHGEFRAEILNYLVDNILVDQYLDQMKIEVDAKEIEQQIDKVKAELQAQGKKLDDVYAGLLLTETELRAQIRATLRWDKFIQQYGPDQTLKVFFDANKAIFDGSAVMASHILIKVPPGNLQAADEAKARIALLKKQITAQVNQGVASATKLDNLEIQKLKMKLLTESFAAAASKESHCPSKDRGGNLGWFPRVGGGKVSESFAKAAFDLKPWDMSEPVVTEFGIHLILCVEQKAGAEPKFEQIRDLVRDVYADKMRETVIAHMRPTAKIEVKAGK